MKVKLLGGRGQVTHLPFGVACDFGRRLETLRCAWRGGGMPSQRGSRVDRRLSSHAEGSARSDCFPLLMSVLRRHAQNRHHGLWTPSKEASVIGPARGE